jgi:hypothetical protein
VGSSVPTAAAAATVPAIAPAPALESYLAAAPSAKMALAGALALDVGSVQPEAVEDVSGALDKASCQTPRAAGRPRACSVGEAMRCRGGHALPRLLSSRRHC